VLKETGFRLLPAFAEAASRRQAGMTECGIFRLFTRSSVFQFSNIPNHLMPGREGSTMEKALEKIAEQILSFDEASLVHLREKYRLKIEHFDGTRDWEKAVIIFCVINAVSMKNALFNENVLKKVKDKKEKKSSPQNQGHAGLKRIK
jgi:hypothetical protein